MLAPYMTHDKTSHMPKPMIIENDIDKIQFDCIVENSKHIHVTF